MTNWGLINDPSPQVFREWANALDDIPCSRIRLGLKKAKDFNGYFKLPAFRKLCQISPQDVGLPDTEQAFLEAAKAPYPKHRQSYSHPIVYIAGQKTGWFDLNHVTNNAKQIFETEYLKLTNQVIDGKTFNMPGKNSITHQKSKLIPKHELKKRLSKMRAELQI